MPRHRHVMKTGPVLIGELLDDLVSYYEQDARKKFTEFLKRQKEALEGQKK